MRVRIAALVCILLLSALTAKAGTITFVNAALKNENTATSSTSVTISISSGNQVTVCVDYDDGSVTPSSVTDTGSNTYTLKANATQNHNVSVWTSASGVSASATSVTVNLPTSTSIARTVIVSVYSGVAAIGGNHTSTNAGSNAPSDSLTTQDANNFVVSCFMQTGSQTWSATTGTLRDSISGSSPFAGDAMFDNTAASASTVTNTAASTNTNQWAAASVELRSTSGTTGPPPGQFPRVF